MKQAPNTSKFKFKKFHKIKYDINQVTKKSFYPKFGLYGLQAYQNSKLTYRNLETGRIILRKFMKKRGNIWIKVFPWAAVTKKPVGARMGKGKGKHSKWISPIISGTIIFEISGVDELIAIKALRKCGLRMPFRFKIVKLRY